MSDPLLPAAVPALPKVVIEVENGMVTSITATAALDVIVLDYDLCLEDGYEDEFGECCSPIREEVEVDEDFCTAVFKDVEAFEEDSLEAPQEDEDPF